MAESQAFDSEIELMDGILKAMHEALAPPAAMFAEAAGELVIPDEAKLAATEDRIDAELPQRQAIEAEIAHLVADLASEIDVRKTEFDNRKQPVRVEKWIGYISKSAMRRLIKTRWHRTAPLTHLAELLRRADRLTGLVRTERDVLLAERRESEGQLMTFIDHRPQIIGTLRSGIGGEMTRVEAARYTGRCVDVFQRFVDMLNGRIATCNILLHKLTADAENVLIHYQAIAEIDGQGSDEGLKPEAFPHLAAEIERFSNGMLTVHGLDKRRERADRSFAERFPAPAEEEEIAEVQPAWSGFRLPAIPRLKSMRS